VLGLLDGPQSSFAAICGAGALSSTRSLNFTLMPKQTWSRFARMPQMNGLEVQACLRRDSPETRIIFISGRDDPPVRHTALDAGALAFLAKPFEDEVLVQLVRKAVASQAPIAAIDLERDVVEERPASERF